MFAGLELFPKNMAAKPGGFSVTSTTRHLTNDLSESRKGWGCHDNVPQINGCRCGEMADAQDLKNFLQRFFALSCHHMKDAVYPHEHWRKPTFNNFLGSVIEGEILTPTLAQKVAQRKRSCESNREMFLC